MKLQLGNWILILGITRMPASSTTGITNHTQDNYFVPFFDYDQVEYKVVKEDIDFFQKNFDIGTAIVSVSSEEKEISGKLVGNYHVVAFTKFNYYEMGEMLKLSQCDEHYKYGYRHTPQRCCVLRITSKLDKQGKIITTPVEYKEIIKAATTRKANLATIDFFEKLYNTKIPIHKTQTDHLTEIEIITYPT